MTNFMAVRATCALAITFCYSLPLGSTKAGIIRRATNEFPKGASRSSLSVYNETTEQMTINTCVGTVGCVIQYSVAPQHPRKGFVFVEKIVDCSGNDITETIRADLLPPPKCIAIGRQQSRQDVFKICSSSPEGVHSNVSVVHNSDVNIKQEIIQPVQRKGECHVGYRAMTSIEDVSFSFSQDSFVEEYMTGSCRVNRNFGCKIELYFSSLNSQVQMEMGCSKQGAVALVGNVSNCHLFTPTNLRHARQIHLFCTFQPDVDLVIMIDVINENYLAAFNAEVKKIRDNQDSRGNERDNQESRATFQHRQVALTVYIVLVVCIRYASNL